MKFHPASLILAPVALALILAELPGQRGLGGNRSTGNRAAPTRSAPARSNPVRSAPTRTAPRASPQRAAPRQIRSTQTPTRTRSFTPSRSAPRQVRSTPTRTRSFTPRSAPQQVRSTPRASTPTRSSTGRTYFPQASSRSNQASPQGRAGSTPPARSTPTRVAPDRSSLYRAPNRYPSAGTPQNTAPRVAPRPTSSRTPVRIRYTTRPLSTPSRTDRSTPSRTNTVPRAIPRSDVDRNPTRHNTSTPSRHDARHTISHRYTSRTPARSGSSVTGRRPGLRAPDTSGGRKGDLGRRNGIRGGNPTLRPPSSRSGIDHRSSRSPRLVNPRRSAARRFAGHRYDFGHHHGRHHIGTDLLGLGFLWHLGWRHRHFYVHDPFYCDYSVGYGWHHYHWRTHCYHPLNYTTWWYPTYQTYDPVTYVYVNDRGDYSPYPSTVVIGAGEGELSGDAPAPDESVSSTESLISRHLTLGDFYFKEGRYKEASESYLRALAYAPEDASLHFLVADAVFALGDYHYAAFLIGKALQLDPTMAYAEADKRKFYGDAEHFEQHMSALRSHLEGKPFDAAGHLVLGYNLKFSGAREAALAAFRRTLELSPGHAAASAFAAALAPDVVDPKPPSVETPVEKAGAPAEEPVTPEERDGE